MGRIIRFDLDRHREAQALLPWYLTGQLDDGERALVEAHLRDCAECQAEQILERRLADAVAQLPFESDHSWSELSRRIRAQGEPRGLLAGARRALTAPGWTGWAVAAQLVLVATGLALVLPVASAPGLGVPAAGPPTYHALGAARPRPTGDVIVIFRPDAKAADLSRALRDSGARLVDGPTAADAYVLEAPLADRAAAIRRLRADAAVSLAEPLDPTEAR